ncbi:MAG: MATE family efflux transporter [Gammaproteobacteria bacterium]|nr:MATE family efflux transporter [Gammaproteobacteria bacterium]
MGLVFNTLYNLSDFWFAGKLSDEALAGVSIAGNVFFLILAIGMGIQTGASAIIAPEVGRGNSDGVAGQTDQVFGLSLILSAVMTVVGLMVAKPLILFLGAEEAIAPLSMEYVLITIIGAFTFVLSFAAAGVLMALGDTKSNRNALAAGFFINLALNPLLTFTLGLGVTGLALATVTIKLISAAYLYWVLANRLGRWSVPKFDFKQHWELLRQVLPASFNMLTILLGGFITVSLVGRFGSEHVAGYAVGLRLEQVLLLPALGLNAAVMAIAGQNFGAGQPERVKETYRKGLLVGLSMAAVSIPVMLFLSPTMMDFFTNDVAIRNTGAAYLRVDAIAFYAYVVLFLSTASLQAIKQPLFPMALGIARQLIIPVTINYILIVIFDFPMMSIFYTIISVVVISSVVAHWYTSRQITRLEVIKK